MERDTAPRYDPNDSGSDLDPNTPDPSISWDVKANDADPMALRWSAASGEPESIQLAPGDTRGGVRGALGSATHLTVQDLVSGPSLITTEVMGAVPKSGGGWLSFGGTKADTANSFSSVVGDFCGDGTKIVLDPSAKSFGNQIGHRYIRIPDGEILAVLLRKVKGQAEVLLRGITPNEVLTQMYPAFADGTLSAGMARVTGSWPASFDDDGRAPEIIAIYTMPIDGSAKAGESSFSLNSPLWVLPGVPTRVPPQGE